MVDHRNDPQDFSLEEILADVRTSREKTSREEEPEQKPATRRVPLYPEREEEPITAEDLAELEEDAEQEGYASGGERRRGLRGLFSRSGSGKANSKRKAGGAVRAGRHAVSRPSPENARRVQARI